MLLIHSTHSIRTVSRGCVAGLVFSWVADDTDQLKRLANQSEANSKTDLGGRVPCIQSLGRRSW